MSSPVNKEKGVWVTQAQVKLTGSLNVATFLAQCVFWSKCEIVKQRSGWFYKTRNEWQSETTLSRYKQERARQRLKELNILQERHERRNDGIRLWFRINTGVLNFLLNNLDQQPSLETPSLENPSVSSDVRSEKTAIKEIISDTEETVCVPTDTKATDDSENDGKYFALSVLNGTKVPVNNTTEEPVYPCYSLNPDDYLFCHVFIYQFVKTQLKGTINRTNWQIYGLAHEELFNRFCNFVDDYGASVVAHYKKEASIDVPTFCGDDITFMKIAGRRMYAAA